MEEETIAPRLSKKPATIKFIEHVRKNQCLYDHNIKKQYGSDFVENVWKKIAQDCCLENGTKAKRKWMYLRARYKCGLVNPAKKSNYHRDLNFLYSFVQSIDVDEDEEVQFLMKKEPENDHYETIERGNSSERLRSSESRRNRSRHLSNENRLSTSSGRQSVFNEYHYPSVPIFPPGGSLHIDHEDELKPFFESLYRSTKKLPLMLQRHIKTQFFEIISAAEASATNGHTE
ncbi:GSCOCG00012898001-RA-CDS [Cotesia congregata]|uniref:MADF domain-containing protein n=2 Tax=Cotesia congregata TaxID=51543 RepID=A0A8J2MU67_COTCN|nr:GSCOCG00012898001-RA-CDS [Cotesia congregata]CAG5111105.1 Protein of unknown function [Cotesia congregata]